VHAPIGETYRLVARNKSEWENHKKKQIYQHVWEKKKAGKTKRATDREKRKSEDGKKREKKESEMRERERERERERGIEKKHTQATASLSFSPPPSSDGVVCFCFFSRQESLKIERHPLSKNKKRGEISR
jgi:hypothetical protein